MIKFNFKKGIVTTADILADYYIHNGIYKGGMVIAMAISIEVGIFHNGNLIGFQIQSALHLSFPLNMDY